MSNEISVTYGADTRVFYDWIPREKLYLSQKAGYDVGVPATIDTILAKYYKASTSNKEKMTEFEKHLLNWMNVPSRDELIAGYFSHAQSLNFRDADGENAARGELIRFGERHYNIPWYQVRITPDLVRDYAKANNLGDKSTEAVASSVGVVL